MNVLIAILACVCLIEVVIVFGGIILIAMCPFDRWRREEAMERAQRSCGALSRFEA